MPYLLDTNIVSDLIRNPDGLVARRIKEIGERQIRTSIVVAAELRYGTAKRGSERLTERMEGVLRTLDVRPFEAPGDQSYGLVRSRLEREGAPIGANDLLIAAHALALGCTLVTDNMREFGRVAGLKVENWLRPA